MSIMKDDVALLFDSKNNASNTHHKFIIANACDCSSIKPTNINGKALNPDSTIECPFLTRYPLNITILNEGFHQTTFKTSVI